MPFETGASSEERMAVDAWRAEVGGQKAPGKQRRFRFLLWFPIRSNVAGILVLCGVPLQSLSDRCSRTPPGEAGS